MVSMSGFVGVSDLETSRKQRESSVMQRKSFVENMHKWDEELDQRAQQNLSKLRQSSLVSIQTTTAANDGLNLP